MLLILKECELPEGGMLEAVFGTSCVLQLASDILMVDRLLPRGHCCQPLSGWFPCAFLTHPDGLVLLLGTMGSCMDPSHNPGIASVLCDGFLLCSFDLTGAQAGLESKASYLRA